MTLYGTPEQQRKYPCLFKSLDESLSLSILRKKEDKELPKTEYKEPENSLRKKIINTL